MTTPPDRYTPRGKWNWNEWKREEPSKENVAACTILNESVRQTERDMLLYGTAVMNIPNLHDSSLYSQRLLDAVFGRPLVTYVCSNEQESTKLKREIEAVDAQIRKDFKK